MEFGAGPLNAAAGSVWRTSTRGCSARDNAPSRYTGVSPVAQ